MSYSNRATILILDKSGSMFEPASNDTECIGFTRMNFACQGANLCVNACPESMFMGIITFDSDATILCPLLEMNKDNKNIILNKISNISPYGGTNIMTAMKLLKQIILEANSKNINIINVINFTDGEDSCLKENNIESYFEQLKINGEFKFKMDTVGFGPNACTKLLIKAANLCSGSYALCFDASMVGTIFGRAIARTYIDENAYGIPESDDEQSSEYYELKNKYHEFRNKLINILLTENKSAIDTLKQEFLMFYETKPINDPSMNPNWYELIIDLESDLNEQISLAFSTPEYWRKWGQAYWQTVGIALDKQYSANFKDKCLQCFGNEIANQEYERICDIYDSMPMIKPSGSIEKRTTVIPQYASVFNNPSGGCFHPNSKIILENGEIITLIQLEQILENGNNIKILKNNNNEYVKIDKLIKIPTNGETQFCQINKVILTPTHPIWYNEAWIHPKSITPIITLNVEYVYNIILQKNQDGIRETSLLVDNEICLALCHNIQDDEIATDTFWGSEKFVDELKRLYSEYDNTNIIEIKHQFIRNSETGYVDRIE